MTTHLRVAAAQIPNVVGDIDGNAENILRAMRWAEDEGCDAVVFPELALTGYPLADLVLRRDFVDRALAVMRDLARQSGRCAAIVGTVDRIPPRRSWDTQARTAAISAAILCDGEMRGMYHKVLLPNYESFDEARNFAPGDRPDAVWRIGQAIAGVAICEDLWSGDGPPEAMAAAGAQILFVPNASPFHREKPSGRLALVSQVARRNGVAVVYVNCVGGQDELVFDGGSLMVGPDGELLYRARQFATENFWVDVPLGDSRAVSPRATTIHARPSRPRQLASPPPPVEPRPVDEQIWEALVVGTRDFARHNGATSVTLGLSGGIDAAVTAAIAVDAVGPANVLGIAMPGPDDPREELEDARRLAEALGIRFETIPLRRASSVVEDELEDVLTRTLDERATESLQARMRTAVLWAVCDQEGHLPLATGNKSELSIGTAALHGDMAGAFAPLKDCPKTLLYRLARLRNDRSPVIPARTLDRVPTAQAVADVAGPPPYDVLDEIVERYVEHGDSIEQLRAAGFDVAVARGVLQLVDAAELKRRQTPPGVKITARAFGQDLRMPITSAWRPWSAEEAEIAPPQPSGAPDVVR